MKKHRSQKVSASPGKDQVSELLILPDGQILVHNLTQPFAELLHELNPDCEQITSRITHPPLLRSGAASHPSPKP
jgi:hypothetical protein